MPAPASIAFLIPTKDRHASLHRTLARVLVAALPVDAEVLLCDQSDAPYAAQIPARVLHRPDLAGLPAARNALLAATVADVVCFLDDDTDIAADFGLRLRELAQREPECAGWGPVVECRPRSVRLLHRMFQLGAFRDPRRLVSRRNDLPTSALFGCCFAVRREAAAATGFDARMPGYALGEDLDFFTRFHRPVRFAACLRAIHRRDGSGRADALSRGRAKAAFLVRRARIHGRGQPATPVHLALALAAAASGRGDEPASARGVLFGAMRHLG